MTDTSVLTTKHGSVTKILLNRPDKLNALSKPLMRSLIRALQEAAIDTECRCVLLSGSGRAFSAGNVIIPIGKKINPR